jgi:carbamate kinase
MRVVIALGGNALSPPDAPDTAAAQQSAVNRAAGAVASIAAHHAVVVTHGNGPQVGLLALQATAFQPDDPVPFDVLGAESEGMIGYMLERALMPVLPGRRFATLLTQVEVSPADSAFASPKKPVGPVYDADKAARLAAEHRWVMGGAGERFRRLVPSPRPLRILELETIRMLVERNVVVVCAGGGGIPVVITTEGEIRGVDGVIDKDRSAALLAEGLAADFLLILTDVDAVHAGWGTSSARPIRRASTDRLRAMSFDPGSMGPKIDSACDFVERTGCNAAIGSLDRAADVLRGVAGTTIAAGKGELDFRASD